MAHHKLLTPLLFLLIVGLLCIQIEAKTTTKNTQASHSIDSGKLYIQVKQTSSSSP